MRILCLNCWGGRIHPGLIAYLGSAEADVLCLQEIVHGPDAPEGWLDYRDGDTRLPQRARLYDEIAAALPGHRGAFSPAARGPLWRGDQPFQTFWGLASFWRHDLVLTGMAQDFVHGAYSHDGYGPHPRARTGLALRLFEPALGRHVTIGQMHGLRDPASGKADTPERAAQAERFAALARGLAQPGDALVLCGDFNVEQDSMTLRHLARPGLTELVTAGGFPGTRNSLYSKPGRHADYMLVDNATPVRHFDIVTSPEISDHCPLLLEI